ncbi:MAG: threonine synthase [Bauldia sp.]|nr:threonine synthase [Bauldia sp.]
MDYFSTRGRAPKLGFADVLLGGLAPDGGLYLPSEWPTISGADIASYAAMPYAEIAADVVSRFTGGDIPDAVLLDMCRKAYAGFAHRAVAPLVQTGPNAWLLELFHGPTLAFKDLAMQLLARLMDYVLDQRGRRATIVGATSGDTGSAAIEAFRGSSKVDVFILFPKGRTSEVQQRQMTTVLDDNVHAIAIEGSFDDCQALVKALFARDRFRERVSMAAINSINWARIVAQTAYYFSSAASLGAPTRKVSFTVPTGNFGDIFAGHVARRMGLPIDRLVIATNRNDILARTFAEGRYEVRGVVPTESPSMDIQVSSNFERLLSEALDHDGAAVTRLMQSLGQSGAFSIPEPAMERLRREFSADRADETETAGAMAAAWSDSGYLADPHTAVALAVAARIPVSDVPMVTLSTAHPAKFPAAVEEATGVRPPLPPHLHDLFGRQERYSVLANDVRVLEHHIEARARAATQEA